MVSKVYANGNAAAATYQYMNGFPFPKGDLNGKCDNFNSPHFLQNDHSECVQSFDIQQECTSTVNPLFFSSLLGVQKGLSAQSKEIKVTLESAYTFNAATNEYVAVSDLSIFGPSILSQDSG